jgi:hypothetical protein
MQSCVIALLLSVILLCPLSSFAQDACFDDATAGRMVVALEQAKIAEQQLSVAAGSNAELQQQAEILKGTIKLMQDQIDIYKNMVDMQNKMADAKDKLFEQQLKAATPTFMDKVKNNIVAGGVGAVLAVVAILLL